MNDEEYMEMKNALNIFEARFNDKRKQTRKKFLNAAQKEFFDSNLLDIYLNKKEGKLKTHVVIYILDHLDEVTDENSFNSLIKTETDYVGEVLYNSIRNNFNAVSDNVAELAANWEMYSIFRDIFFGLKCMLTSI